MRKFVTGLFLGITVFLFLIYAKADGAFVESVFDPASQCKHINAECSINESGKSCCEGLVCEPFNAQSENGKCAQPTATPTAVPSVTPSVLPSTTPNQCPVQIVNDCGTYLLHN